MSVAPPDPDRRAPAAQDPLLVVEDLCVEFRAEGGLGDAPTRAVDGVSFALGPGETLALVGESGSGKSATALALLGLLPAPEGRVTGGRARFAGRELLALAPEELRALRGRELGIVFQEVQSALNPVFTAGEQVAETLRLHLGLGRREARARAVAELARMGIPDPERCARAYPHQLSGGMRQRVLLAIAMAPRPALLVADEPTTALDVTVQAQILVLIRRLREESGTAVLLITHDLGVVAESADRVAVMYAGRVVETADVAQLFHEPRHPYTQGLLRSLPDRVPAGERLPAIQGSAPEAGAFPSGCRFRTRCPLAEERCAEEEPRLLDLPRGAGGDRHRVACHLAGGEEMP